MESSNKELFIYQCMDAMHDTFLAGKTFRLPVIGSSMEPTLREGDSVVLGAKDKLRKGDIVLYKVDDTTYNLHRILKVGDILHIAGDNNIIIERVPCGNVVAVVRSIRSNGNVINRGSFRYRWMATKSKMRRFARRVKRKLAS